MSDPRIRSDVARVAARLMYERVEREYYTAKRKAARQLKLDSAASFRDLPSNAEIREQIDVLARMHEGESRGVNLCRMRLCALRLLRLLDTYSPRLIGSVLTGHIRHGSDIDLHIFCDSPSAVADTLESLGYPALVEHKRVLKHHESRVYVHARFEAPGPENTRFAIELTIYPENKRSYVFKSSITGRAIEKATHAQLEAIIRQDHPETDVERALADLDAPPIDAHEYFAVLLAPLEQVKQNPKYHPEGDALYHSLQVFQLAYSARPWDEEFLVAALLHDVGKAIDPQDHVIAGLEALGNTVTKRTRFLIRHHMDALHLRDGTLGRGAARALRAHPDFDDLMLLRELDSGGRQGGVIVPTIDQALEMIRAVSEECSFDQPPSSAP